MLGSQRLDGAAKLSSDLQPSATSETEAWGLFQAPLCAPSPLPCNENLGGLRWPRLLEQLGG